MSPQTITFVCPKCDLSVEAIVGSHVSHNCAANHGRETQFRPQPIRKDPTR